MIIKYRGYAIGEPIRLIRKNSKGMYLFGGVDPAFRCDFIEGDTITFLKINGYMRTSAILEKVIDNKSDITLVLDDGTEVNVSSLQLLGLE